MANAAYAYKRAIQSNVMEVPAINKNYPHSLLHLNMWFSSSSGMHLVQNRVNAKIFHPSVISCFVLHLEEYGGELWVWLTMDPECGECASSLLSLTSVPLPKCIYKNNPKSQIASLTNGQYRRTSGLPFTTIGS